ncbi:SCO family protein [Bradyrhizobium genosp. L]|uniref:SCO family protein n=1 Tax=Bradyrhizobium genosp. L TaxID=83637 RepID=UPI0018A2C7E4|nr:SCO family protein [Bradyrhizobium genosp. L]QPF86448.1 SCO family protein [Bradyrhizobium genosp. L]
MAIAGNATHAMSEDAFAGLVDRLAADPAGSVQLTDLLREEHPLYGGRGAATVVRMRGWILLALARASLSDQALIFVLEELDTGLDPYLVAAAARALRSHTQPNERFAPFLARALDQVRYHDEPISFASYGEYATSSSGTSAVAELLATLAWLGPNAQMVLPALTRWRAEQGLSRKLRLDLDRTLQAIRAPATGVPSCCGGLPDGKTIPSRTAAARSDPKSIDAVVLQDQDGKLLTFSEFFRGCPSIVVFFYTRCDNPMKCSLSVTKLARIQALLGAQGLSERLRTAAITYDPEFDRPERLRVYGKDRAVRMDENHRMLRAVEGHEALRDYFELGVNYVESLVNRHRIELYVLDGAGQVAVSFERLHWDEEQIVAAAVATLNEQGSRAQA